MRPFVIPPAHQLSGERQPQPFFVVDGVSAVARRSFALWEFRMGDAE